MIFKNGKTVMNMRTVKYQVTLSADQVTEVTEVTKMLKNDTVNYTRKNCVQILLDLDSEHGKQYK